MNMALYPEKTLKFACENRYQNVTVYEVTVKYHKECYLKLDGKL